MVDKSNLSAGGSLHTMQLFFRGVLSWVMRNIYLNLHEYLSMCVWVTVCVMPRSKSSKILSSSSSVHSAWRHGQTASPPAEGERFFPHGGRKLQVSCSELDNSGRRETRCSRSGSKSRHMPRKYHKSMGIRGGDDALPGLKTQESCVHTPKKRGLD